ncbi:hypothetical protein BDFB_008106 [Asbolus verrucosus]|uniref:Uncharacterized protein n=1 Tax=Asbolus verrucosus TaxID=1661398 RepID=A0A482VIC1_ASBVE|nr:hypothetical protein BDFB_008106 [Asbolus verrucosus]
MDYSYLNQAAGFDSSCLQGAGMDPTGLGNMPCSYGDLTSCSQMSQAAYRYTAAAASMARSYNPPGGSMGVHHPGAASSQCAVMGTRPHVQDVHRASMFPSSMNLQSKSLALLTLRDRSRAPAGGRLTDAEAVLSFFFSFRAL